jgi:hypothetical protein
MGAARVLPVIGVACGFACAPFGRADDVSIADSGTDPTPDGGADADLTKREASIDPCAGYTLCDTFERADPDGAPWTGREVESGALDVAAASPPRTGRALVARMQARPKGSSGHAYLSTTAPSKLGEVRWAMRTSCPALAPSDGNATLLHLFCGAPARPSLDVVVDPRGIVATAADGATTLFDRVLTTDTEGWHEYTLRIEALRLAIDVDGVKKLDEAAPPAGGPCTFELGPQVVGSVPAFDAFYDDFRAR